MTGDPSAGRLVREMTNFRKQYHYSIRRFAIHELNMTEHQTASFYTWLRLPTRQSQYYPIVIRWYRRHKNIKGIWKDYYFSDVTPWIIASIPSDTVA
jgi:hypothetical protein